MLIFLIILHFESFSQKTFRKEIAHVQHATISRVINFNESNKPVDTVFYLIGRDVRYPHIFTYIGLRTGTYMELDQFLKGCKDFIETSEPGTGYDINSTHLSIEKIMGIKVLQIFGTELDSQGYTQFTKAQITKLLLKFEESENQALRH